MRSYSICTKLRLFLFTALDDFQYLHPNNGFTIYASANESDSSLKVVHRHGPCFKPNGEKGKWPSHTEILLQDQSRVNSIHSKLSAKTSGRLDKMKDKGSTLTAIHGSVVGSGNYIVTVGIGTPKRKFSLIFDTGSDLTWTQCKPCAGFCYQQKEKIFDPKLSKSYRNVSCSSAVCSSLESATGKYNHYSLQNNSNH